MIIREEREIMKQFMLMKKNEDKLLAEKQIDMAKYKKKLAKYNYDITRITTDVNDADSDYNNKELFRELQEMETIYFDDGLAQDAWNLRDDLVQKGYIGFKSTKHGINGYICGYDVSSDELSTLEDIDFSTAVFYTENDDLLTILKNDNISITDKVTKILALKCFYISNLVVKKEARSVVYGLLSEMINVLRKNGYKYIISDGLVDTQNMLFNKKTPAPAAADVNDAKKVTRDGELKSRITDIGLSVIATMPSDYGSLLNVIRIESSPH